MSHRIRSVSSEQQTRHTGWPIAASRRKPLVLSKSTLDPRSLSDILNCQFPLRVRTWPEIPLWPSQQRLFVKARFCAGYDSMAGFPDFTESITQLDYSHILNVSTPLFLWRRLWIVVDISAYQSQQSGAVICSVMRKSQCATHEIMEIWNIRAINHNSTWYYAPGGPLRKRIKS